MSAMANPTQTLLRGEMTTSATVTNEAISQAVFTDADNISPLSGVSVIDMTRIVAGPYCSMILGDLGADIIKIENPVGGDEARKWGPPFLNDTDESCYFASLNRNKKSVCIDIRKPSGSSIIYDLVKKCDVLIENYVPGKLDEYDLGYEKLKMIAPHLIYCSVTGYGADGPYASKPGYDVITAGFGGLLSITGSEGGPPAKVGVPMTDMATGLYAYGSILAALLLRQRTGKGQKIDCNLLATQVASLINLSSNFLNSGMVAKRRGTAHESIVPYQAFTTNNGHLIIGAGSDKQFQALCKVLGIDHVSKENKYCTNIMRVKNRNDLLTILGNIFITKSTEEWLNILEGSPFPFGPVNTIDKVFADSQVQHLNMVKELDHPTAGKLRVVGPPVRFSDGGNYVRSSPPILGEHTSEILSRFLGYSDKEIASLKSQKTSQPQPLAVLKLRKARTEKKVEWTNDTVDNENMNKKKSKCCCIYEKKKAAGGSDSDDSEDECDNCSGHVERKKHHHHPEPTPNTSDPASRNKS